MDGGEESLQDKKPIHYNWCELEESRQVISPVDMERRQLLH